MDTETKILRRFITGRVREPDLDIRNSLNGLNFETQLLEELVSDGEALKSVERIRIQLRTLADQLHGLSIAIPER